MALAADGVLMSYDSESLIREVKRDLKEFGDIDVTAFYEKKDGVNIVVDYLWKEDMSNEEMELRELAPTEEEYMWKTKLKNLLKYLRLQNDPINTDLETQGLIEGKPKR